MADYKNYIVRYDIQTDVTKATEGLERIAAIAKQFETPMKELSKAISTVNSSMRALHDSANIKFNPQIDVRAFNSQLKGMVLQVKSAAIEMHSALYGAIRGDGAATNAMKQGISKSLGVKSVKELASSIEAYEKELDKLMGTRKKGKDGRTTRAKDGSIHLAQNAGLSDRVLELKSRKEAIQRQLKKTRDELAAAKQIEKEVEAAKAKSESAAKKAAPVAAQSVSTQAAKLTNVTPAVIKEWKKAFGDAKEKSLIVKIHGDASGPKGALTVIKQVQTALKSLQSQSTFSLNLTLNMEGFAAAEAQLKSLASLSKSVMAPFAGESTKKQGKTNTLAGLTKDEQLKLQQAEHNAKEWQNKINAVQKRLDENQAKYDKQPTSSLKGQITRDTNKLVQYKESLGVHQKTIDELQSKVAPAVQAQQKNIKPITVDLIGNLSSVNTNGKEFSIPIIGEITKIQNKVKEAMPVDVKVMADQVNASLRAIPRPTLVVNVRLNNDDISRQLQGVSASAITVKPDAKPDVKPVVEHPATVKKVFPALTAAEEAEMKNLMSVHEKLNKAQEAASKNLDKAKEKHAASGSSDRTFKQLQEASKKYNEAYRQYTEAQNKLNSLMHKQFQSTASRMLTEEEMLQGIKAQNTVDQLLSKKRLSAAQKAELGQAQAALKELRAPAPSPIVPTAKVPTAQPPQTTKPASVPVTETVIAKDVKKGQPTTVNAIANIVGTRTATEVSVPVIGELTKVIAKLTSDVTIPIIGKIDAANIKEQIEKIPRPTLTVNVRLNTDGISKQLEALGATSTAVKPNVKEASTAESTAAAASKLAGKQTFPALTAAEKTKMESLLTNFAKLDKAQSVAAKNLAEAEKQHAENKKDIESRTKLREASQKYAEARKQYTAAYKELKPLMFKQFQSTASRLLTDEEIVQGIAAQNKVDQLKDKKRLTAAQKSELAQAQTTLKSLRAQLPAAPSAPAAKPVATPPPPQAAAPATATEAVTAKGSKKGQPATVNAIANITGVRTATEVSVPVVGRLTKVVNKLTKDVSIPVVGKLNVANLKEQIKEIPRPTLPINMKLTWEKGAIGKNEQLKAVTQKMPAITLQLDPTQAIAKLNEFITLVASKSPQNIALTASGTAANAPASATNAITPAAVTGATGAVAAATSASAAVSNKNTTKSTSKILKNRSKHLSKANLLRSQAYNYMLQFAQNQSQLNTLVKYRKFFKRGISETNIMPTPDMPMHKMLQYLQGVSKLMQDSHVQVPWQLQSQINKLTKKLDKVGGMSSAAGKAMRMEENPMSFYTRSRKWAYPFTGNTSFGATTPMAVDMAKGMGVMFAVGGAMSAVGSSLSQAVEYQNIMRTTNAILKNGTETYTPAGFSNMERTVRDVGIKTKFSAPEVASAARFLAMAGYDIDAINHSISSIADLALIGDTDLGETADKMTNIMTTFGIAPERMREAANIMTTTATRSNTDLMMLAESAKYGGGVANMYGYNDPNLFADTMALFGVMGNAGIQASSAGTALRMMYQNIFKPNKNQKAVLEQLKRDYGISTLDSFGKFRALSDILNEMATRIPEDKMATIVGNLFRITAQPGAAATLRAAAQEDNSDVAQVAGGIDAVASLVGKEGGLSTLLSLMHANRESVTGNVSGNIALEKQNTIHGLWAQVTSTFTEGILKAFEQNEGGFSDMLIKLRDYLAKPETVQMIQRLFNMIVEIGKVMAKFVEYWADLYNMFPGIIEQWVKWQMIFTQIGALMTPLISVIGVFDRLRSVLMAIVGVDTAVTTGKAIGNAAAANAVIGASTATAVAASITNRMKATPAPLGGMPIGIGFGRKHQSYESSAAKYNQFITNAMLASGFVERKWYKPNTWFKPNINNLSNRERFASRDNRLMIAHENAQRYREMAENRGARRERQISNSALLSRASRHQWNQGNRLRGLGTAYRAGITYMSFAGLFNLFSSIKGLFSSLSLGLAKSLGMLINPFTAAIAAIGGLGYWVYNLSKYADSATDAQIRAHKKLTDEFEQSFNTVDGRHKNVQDFLNRNGMSTAQMDSYNEPDKNAESRQNAFASSYKYLFNKDILTSNSASRKSNQEIVDTLRRRYINDSTMRLALSEKEYEELLGSGLFVSSALIEDEIARQPWSVSSSAVGGNFGLSLANMVHNRATGEKDAAIQLLNKAAALAVKNEGAKDSKVLEARKQIVELRKQLGDTDKFRVQAMRILNNTVNPNDFNLFGDEYITLENLENPNFDWSKLHSYVLAGYNVLKKEIDGSEGSIVRAITAMEELKKNLIPYSEKWNNAISGLVNNFRIIRNIGFNGKMYENIEMLMKTLPDGTLDFTDIIKQIQQKIKGFKGNIEFFIEIANKVYQMMIDAGAKIEDSPEARQKFIYEQLKSYGMSDKEIARYYVPTEEDKKREVEKNKIERDPLNLRNVNVPERPKISSPFEQYQNNLPNAPKEPSIQAPMAAPDLSAPYMAGWAAEKQKEIDNAKRNAISVNTAKDISDIKKTTEKYTNNTVNNGVDGNGATDPKDQDSYASKYTSASARPTQIVFNIDKLANFDRTTVAASSEEKDLIASMETKIAEAVYRIFAEAANSANNLVMG